MNSPTPLSELLVSVLVAILIAAFVSVASLNHHYSVLVSERATYLSERNAVREAFAYTEVENEALRERCQP